MKNKTIPLFEIETTWQEEWKDMPEFIQKKQQEYSKIIIRFENEIDLQEFSELIGQKLTKKTKSIWFPFKSHWGRNPKLKYYHVES